MKLMIAAALTVAMPGAALAQPAKQSDQKTLKDKADDFDIGKVMAVFDKLFPAQPEPAPARLALARTTARGVLPDGTYAALFDEFMVGMVDRVLALSPGDLGEKGKGSATLRHEIAKDDPYFDQRMKIVQRVIGEELVKISAVMEPKLRDGLARSIARRFDERQLKDINAFLATDSGRAFAGQTMRLWVDPDVMRSMAQSVPHMIGAVPGAMIRLEAETAHLPKPKKKDPPKPIEPADPDED